MTACNSTTSSKPGKPYPGFPLFPHQNGQWAKKVRGKLHYFGPWADHQAALARYLTERNDLEAGRSTRVSTTPNDTITVGQMVGLYLDAKKLKVASGEMGEATWKVYESFCVRMLRVWRGSTLAAELGPTDFQKYRNDLQKTHKSLESIKSALCKTKAVFNWAGPGINGQGYLTRLPRYGDAFRPPSPTALQRAREEVGIRVFTAEQLKTVF
ncbi:MAG: hypothetical protein ABFC77_14320 [Thermoguttaceae bacterium]